jgi:hypothetical protein
MIDVVCFCGHAYSFVGDSGICAHCGEPLSTPQVKEGRDIDTQLDQLVRGSASDSPPEELAT